MITLSRIYTKTGDQGKTSLGDGTRRFKHDVRVECYGQVDELNAVLGVAVSEKKMMPEILSLLRLIQNDLFDIGADLCHPEKDTKKEKNGVLRIAQPQIDRLEQEIDRYNAELFLLKSFVLPGGTVSSSWLHMARVVARRAERGCSALCEKEKINPLVLVYLNRLSDLFFVLARIENSKDAGDVLWKPGANR